MTSNIQISGKANDGTIFVVGGDNYDDFFVNLSAAIGDISVAQQVVNEAVRILIPTSVGSSAPSFEQAQQNVQNSFAQQPPQNVVQGNFQQQPQYQQQSRPAPAGPPPGAAAPACPNHGQPAKWVPPGVAKATGKPYQGFWSCAVSERGDRSCRISTR
jgi:hypothetical protein